MKENIKDYIKKIIDHINFEIINGLFEVCRSNLLSVQQIVMGAGVSKMTDVIVYIF